jgi:hypothetical protein
VRTEQTLTSSDPVACAADAEDGFGDAVVSGVDAALGDVAGGGAAAEGALLLEQPAVAASARAATAPAVKVILRRMVILLGWPRCPAED